MASVAQMKAERSALIEDLISIAAKYKDSQVTRDLYRAHGKFSERVWQRHFPKFKDFRKAAGINNDPAKAPEPETQEFKDGGDTWSVVLPNTSIHTLDELLDYMEVDRKVWSVDSWVCNKWDANAGQGNVLPLYQVKATLKKRKAEEAIFAEIAAIKAEAKTWAPIPKPIVRPVATPSGNMLELMVPDLHLGKLAHADETGYQNYDTKIAIETFYRALETIIARTAHYKFDQVLFPVGNDLLQADNQESETYNGTRVDTDSRYKKTFTKARLMIATAIERLRQIAPVKVVMVEGNHDRSSIFFLGEILTAQFSNYTDVTVDNTLPTRKYHRHGVNLIGLTHGDKGKLNDYALTMAAEAKEDWALTLFREFHVGHKHISKSDEFHGVKIRTFPSLGPADYWHGLENYTGSLRSAVGIVWNATEGPIAEVSYHEDAYQAAA